MSRPTFPAGRSETVCFAHVPRFVVCDFSFKADPISTVTTIVDERTGEEKERLINKGRWKGSGPMSVSIAEKGVSGSCHLSLGRRTRSSSDLRPLYRGCYGINIDPRTTIRSVHVHFRPHRGAWPRRYPTTSSTLSSTHHCSRSSQTS